jgi:ParB/RepB/Spo0J family partition protein
MTIETITQILLDDLHESPFNPRRSFTGIEDLAASIQSEGRVHEPLLVRPITPNPLRDDLVDGYQIVFGHRRFRAAELAGLATVPCMVRAMSDAEARCAQIAENLQRADVHPIEEAEGFRAMLENDGISADELVELVGKSRSYIYGRLKLLQACPEVRQACLDGKIGSEVALLVARLRTPQLQAKALAAIKQDTSQHSNLEDGGKKSFRHIRDLLADKFTLDLGRAIFDPDDPRLVASAGVCSACPKLTGNAPEFEDLAAPSRAAAYVHHYRPGGPRLCTDPDCFAAKKAAHLEATAAALTAAGETVITGNKAKAAVDQFGKLKAGYVPLKDVQAQLKKAGAAATVVTVLNQKTGQTIKAVKMADLPATVAKAHSPAARGQAQQRDWAAEQRERAATAQAETERRRAAATELRPRMLAAPGSTDELRLVVHLVRKFIDWQVEERVLPSYGLRKVQHQVPLAEQLQELQALTADQLRGMLLDFVLEESCEVEEYQPTKGADLLDALRAVYAPAAPAARDTHTADLFGSERQMESAAA